MATEYTPNYNLDLYVSADKPNLRDQYNAAMGKIDAELKNQYDDNIATNNNIGTLQTQMRNAESNIDTLQTQQGSTTSALEQLTETVNGFETQIAGKAPTNHASSATTYGAASLTQYGHVKLSDAASQDGSETATAATPVAVSNAVATAVDDLNGSIESLQSGKAPTNHAAAGSTYGLGSASMFGHVKVVDSGTAEASTGTAASPKMVNDAVNVAPTVLTTESVNFTNMTETLSVSVILNAKANMICVSLGEAVVHTTAAINRTVTLTYKLPEQYRPTRKLRTALCVSAAKITVGMNATVDTDGTIGISFGASEAIDSGYTVGGNAMFIYGLS